MDAFELHEVGHMFSCCEPCVRKRRWKQIFTVVTFMLMTFDLVTDWLNWIQWLGVGGYDQYYFVSIFERLFLCIAAVGTGLWIIEVFVIVKKWINIYHEPPHRIPSSIYHTNFHEFLPEPDINYSLFDLEPKTANDDKPLSEPEIRDDKPPSQSEVINDDKPSEMEVRNEKARSETEDDKTPSEQGINNNDSSAQEVRNDDKPLFEPDGSNDDKLSSELDINNDDKFSSGPEVRNDSKTPSEPNVTKDDKPKSDPVVRYHDKTLSERDVRNDDKPPPETDNRNRNYFESGRNDDEREEKPKDRRAINRLGILAHIIVGLLEDFPVVLAVNHLKAMPMCGIPAKQNAGSSLTLATIISSMLSSFWTMISLFCEMWSCPEGGFCCVGTKKHKKEKPLDVETTDRNHRQNTARLCLKRPFKVRMKKIFLKAGKIIVSILVFLIFSTIFLLGFLTICHVKELIKISIKIRPFVLVPHVLTVQYGPGRDARPDQAMFIYLQYKLPKWHYITLNDSKLTKNVPFRRVVNRIYIGQFQELSHLKDGTLIKGIPCRRAMPFLPKIDKHTFYWENHPESEEEYANCKIIFTLRYFPTNNDWQPFEEIFVHHYFKFITVEYGFHINNKKTCPTWFNPQSSSFLLSQQVQEDLMNYTCNSNCSEVSDICRNLKSWNSDLSQGISYHLVEKPSLVIHDLETPDTCEFDVTFEYSHRFCEKSWGEVEAVTVPEKIKDVYPQFITVPAWYDGSRNLMQRNCTELW